MCGIQVAKIKCPEGWIQDPKNKNQCIWDKKVSIKRGMEEYKKWELSQPERKKPATDEEIEKMQSDYQKRVDKLPNKGKLKKKNLKKKKKFWSIYD